MTDHNQAETIDRCAIVFTEHVTISLPRPNRHVHLIAHYNALTGTRGNSGLKQGFITSLDRFVDRTEAAKIAFAAGQIAQPKCTLYSEDLW